MKKSIFKKIFLVILTSYFVISCKQVAHVDSRLKGTKWIGDNNINANFDFSVCNIADLNKKAKCIQDKVLSKVFFKADFYSKLRDFTSDEKKNNFDSEKSVQEISNGKLMVRDILTDNYPKKDTINSSNYKTNLFGYRVVMKFEYDHLMIKRYKYSIMISFQNNKAQIYSTNDQKEDFDLISTPFAKKHMDDLGNELFLLFTTIHNNNVIFTTPLKSNSQISKSLNLKYEVKSNQLIFKEGSSFIKTINYTPSGVKIIHSIVFSDKRFKFIKQ